MRSKPIKLIYQPLLGAALSASACIEASAEIPRVCFLEQQIEVEPIVDHEVGITGSGGLLRDGIDLIPTDLVPSVSIEESFVRKGLDSIPEHYERLGFEGSVSLLHVDVIARAGLESFDTFERVGVRIEPVEPSPGLGARQLGICEREEGCDTSQGMVRLTGNPDQDLVPYLRAGSLEITLELIGQPPIWTWVFDVDVCMRAVGNYRRMI